MCQTICMYVHVYVIYIHNFLCICICVVSCFQLSNSIILFICIVVEIYVLPSTDCYHNNFALYIILRATSCLMKEFIYDVYVMTWELLIYWIHIYIYLFLPIVFYYSVFENFEEYGFLMFHIFKYTITYFIF